MSKICAHRLQSTDLNQSLQTTQEINGIETNNDNKTKPWHILPVRGDNKAAERSRLYRKRHQDKINQRRRDIRKCRQNSRQIHADSDLQNIEQISHSTLNGNKNSKSHTQRQQRYYERHKEEINKRKRDNRTKKSILQLIPATGAERNRNYRERNKQEINKRRRESRLRQRNLQRLHADEDINNIDVVEQVTETTNDQESLNSSNENIIQEKAQKFTSPPQHDNTQQFAETCNDRVQDLQTIGVTDVRRKWSHIRNSYSRHLRNEMTGARTGRGRAVSRWCLADELHFLRDHMATDTRTSPYPANSLLKMDESERNVEGQPSFGAVPWDDSRDSCSSFDLDENSSYFQFFRGIHSDYLDLPLRKQRVFRRQCLALLHSLLDEEDNTPINLTAAAAVKQERSDSFCVVENIPYQDEN